MLELHGLPDVTTIPNRSGTADIAVGPDLTARTDDDVAFDDDARQNPRAGPNREASVHIKRGVAVTLILPIGPQFQGAFVGDQEIPSKAKQETALRTADRAGGART